MQERRQEPLSAQRNVYGEPLKACSERPLTGFFRTRCHTGPTISDCTRSAPRSRRSSWAFSKARGNDSTPQPDFDFRPARRRWCPWRAAKRSGRPRAARRSRRTHEATLETVDFGDLKRYAIDLA